MSAAADTIDGEPRRDAAWGLVCALGDRIHVTGWLDRVELAEWGPIWVWEAAQAVGVPVRGVLAGRLTTTGHGRRLHLDRLITAAAINEALAGFPPRTPAQIGRELAAQGLLRTETDNGRTRYSVVVRDAQGQQFRAWDIDLSRLRAAMTGGLFIPEEPDYEPSLRPRTRRGELLPTSPPTDPLSGAPDCYGGWKRSRQRWRPNGQPRGYGAADPMLREFDFTIWPTPRPRPHPIVEIRRKISGVTVKPPWDWPEDPAHQLHWYINAVDAWNAAIARQTDLAEGIIASLCELHRYGFRWRDIELHLAPVRPAERQMAARGRFQPARLASWVRREGDRWDNPIARYGWLARLCKPQDALEQAAAREIYLLADGLHRAGWSVAQLVDVVDHRGPTAAMIRRRWREWDRSNPRGPGPAANYVRAVLREAADLPADTSLRLL